MLKIKPKPLSSLQIINFHSLSATATLPPSASDLIALCNKGHLREAFTTHFSLIWSYPTLFSHLLRSCIQHRSLFPAQQLHSIAITSGCSIHKFITNHLVNAYIKLGQLNTGQKLFDRMSEKNIMSYNILIGGFMENGELGTGVEIFNQMSLRNLASWNAVIVGLVKFELNEEGLKFFSNMHRQGFLPDAYTLGSVLRGCAGLKNLIKGRQVHSYGMRLGLESDLVVGSSLSHMYMKCGCLDEGERVVQSMPVHNVIIFNTLIAGRVQNGFAIGAMRKYNVMKMSGFVPDKITFVSVISSCSDLATLGQGQQIHAEVIKHGAMWDVSVCSSLISMYSRCGCLDDAVKMFYERGALEDDDSVLWSSIIAAYGFHGRGQEAIKLFQKMENECLKPDDVTFLSLLYSCSHCGFVNKGLEFFDLMVKKYHLKPQLKHYTCVVDLLGRSGRLEDAECFIRSMHVRPDTIIWKTLLSACKTHKNAESARRISEEILKIDPQDSASYVLLSNSEASAEKWNDVSEVRNAITVKKEPGLSWVELKNEVHIFKPCESSHPQSEEIESYLKNLIVELKLNGYVPHLGCVMHDMDMEEKEYNLVRHSEKLAVAFVLMYTPENVPIRIMKNLRVCDDCHAAMKLISLVKNREIIVRDGSRFHHFKHGQCSCRDYW